MRLFQLDNLKKTAVIIAVAIDAFMVAGPACGQEGDVFRPYVNLSYMYDDNIRRFNSEERALAITGREDMADTVLSTNVGVILDKKISRQKVKLDFSISSTKYDQNSELDNTGRKFTTTWDWVLGNYWKGVAQHSHRKSMVPFGNFFGTTLNMLTEDSSGLDVVRRLHPRWQLRGGLKKYDLEYDTSQLRGANLREVAKELELDYLTPAGNMVGIVYRHAVGDRPVAEVINGVLIDNSYRENSVKANVDWIWSGKTRVQFLGGYLERKHDELSSRDFQGWNARANAYWDVTGKTKLNFGLWREANAQSFVTATYTINKGASVGVVWSASAKISIQGSYTREQMEFAGDSIGGIPGQDREDLRKISSISLIYRPAVDWQVNTFVNHNTRSSTNEFFAFSSTGMGLSIRYEY